MKMEIKNKKVGVAILIPEKIDFKMMAIAETKKDPATLPLGYLSKEIQNTYSKIIRIHVYCSIIYNSQDMEAT